MKKLFTLIFSLVVVALVAGGYVLFVSHKMHHEVVNLNPTDTTQPANTTPTENPLEYTNTDYGFTVSLPEDWKGYSVVTGTWQADSSVSSASETTTIQGPMISLRNPSWTEAVPYQDIPVMIFTKAQWAQIQNNEFHIGAAPINPSELAHNDTYVFGLPARYNYAYRPDWQEVDQLLQNHAVQAIEP
jgi:hypothetical protein